MSHSVSFPIRRAPRPGAALPIDCPAQFARALLSNPMCMYRSTMRFYPMLFAALLSSCAFAQSGTLIVVNQKQHVVDLVDPRAGKLITAINVGVNGHEIALSKDARTAYVPIYSNTGVGKPGTDGQMIDVIDLPSAKVVKEIDLGHPVRPHKVLLAPDGNLYVSAELDHAIDIVDPSRGTVVGHIPTDADGSHIFAVTPDWSHAYTANVLSGSVSVLDLKSRKLVKVIPLTHHVQRMAVSIDGRFAFTSDNEQPRVAVIDTRTNALSQWVPVHGIPYVTEPTLDGRFLVVAAADDGKGILNILDLRTFKVVRTIPTNAPVISFLQHDGLLYGSCAINGAVEVLDMHAAQPDGWNLLAPIQLAPGVDAMAWTNNI
jgi:DNA-binding beta-propeller fold protein YncE